MPFNRLAYLNEPESLSKIWAKLTLWPLSIPKAKISFPSQSQNRRGSCFTMNITDELVFELNEYKAASGKSRSSRGSYAKKPRWMKPNFYGAMSFYKMGQI